MLFVVCTGAMAWALYELFVWLPRKRRELEEISRRVHEWERDA